MDEDLHVFQPVELDDILEGPFKFNDNNWALLTAQKDDTVNTMTISWGGVTYIWGRTCAVLYVRESSFTRELIDSSKRLSLSFLDRGEFAGVRDYLGSASGRHEDKIAGSGLHVNYFEDIPFIDEAGSVIICRVLYRQKMVEDCFMNGRVLADHYRNEDYHYTYIAEIKRVMIR
jgi:flavin reductase (DIM6/NTAB) family NADH-FMN oxidoreductase RutF